MEVYQESVRDLLDARHGTVAEAKLEVHPIEKHTSPPGFNVGKLDTNTQKTRARSFIF